MNNFHYEEQGGHYCIKYDDWIFDEIVRKCKRAQSKGCLDCKFNKYKLKSLAIRNPKRR